jgi:hypothetical protein
MPKEYYQLTIFCPSISFWEESEYRPAVEIDSGDGLEASSQGRFYLDWLPAGILLALKVRSRLIALLSDCLSRLWQSSKGSSWLNAL